MTTRQRAAVFVGAFLGVTFIAYAVGFDPSTLHRWTDDLYSTLNPFRFWLLAVRWCVFVAVWWFWPEIVARFVPDSLPRYEERRVVLLGMRHRIFAVIAVLEICLQFARL